MTVAALDLTQVGPGFSDPARDSQAVFRRLMNAMARPGLVVDLDQDADPSLGVHPAAAAVALTLFDFETSVWLSSALSGGVFEGWLRFHAGCPFVSEPGKADFAVVASGADCPALSDFNPGDAKYPDRSTTILLQVDSLEGGDPVILTGPGVKGERRVAPAGLPANFWSQIQENNKSFQFGVDVFLVAGSQLMALPRSTRVRF